MAGTQTSGVTLSALRGRGQKEVFVLKNKKTKLLALVLAAMLLVGFGWAKPVPVDMRYFKDPKKGMALTALAGPMSNFLMAALCCIPLRWLLPLVLRMDNLQSPLVWLYNFLITLILMNLGFNW